MTIYTHQFPSSKPMPYVYRGYNPTTSESYIGYHMANVKKNIPSSSDLGVVYFTSSRYVKHRFHEFSWTIVAEFFNASDAYDFEQLLIFESWKLPGSLNKHCTYGNDRFMAKGPHSDEHKLKISISWKNRAPMSDKTKLKMSIASKCKPKTDEAKLKMSIAKKGKPKTDEHKLNISVAKKGKPKSEETKLNMSIAKNNMSEETKLKMSIAKNNMSEETKLKMSITQKKRWADKNLQCI